MTRYRDPSRGSLSRRALCDLCPNISEGAPRNPCPRQQGHVGHRGREDGVAAESGGLGVSIVKAATLRE